MASRWASRGVRADLNGREPESSPRSDAGGDCELLGGGCGITDRVALATAYAAGLRIGEVCRLKVTSIDSKRMLIHVDGGKGAKDRYAMLSPRLLYILRAYWKRAVPACGCFRVGSPAITSHRRLQDAVGSRDAKLKLGKPVTADCLRHSFVRRWRAS